MCPAILQVAVAAFGAVVGFQGQNQAYKAQQEMYKNNRDAANKAAVNTYASTQNRQLQEGKAVSQEKQKLNIEAMKGRSTAEVAAGEAGVTGLSVDALISDYYGQQGRYDRTLTSNHDMQADYLRGEMEGTKANAEGRINSVDQGQKPNFLDAAVRILGAGVDAYSSSARAKLGG